MSKSLTVCSEWRPGLNIGNFKTVHHQGLVTRAAALPPLLCNAEHYWTNFHRWLCFLDYAVWNTWTWFGEGLSAHKCNRIQYGMCLEHVNCNCKYSKSSQAVHVRHSKLVGPFYLQLVFCVCKLRQWHFTLEVFCMGFGSACEAVRCRSAGRAWIWDMKYADGWKEVVCNKDGKTLGHVLNTRDKTIYWTSFTLHSYKASFCGGKKVFAHKIN